MYHYTWLNVLLFCFEEIEKKKAIKTKLSHGLIFTEFIAIINLLSFIAIQINADGIGGGGVWG